MSGSLAGWVLIGLSALLLLVFIILFKHRNVYPIRRMTETETLLAAQISAMERGQPRQVILGNQFWSHPYPGLGLQALSVLPLFLDLETAVDGGLTVSASDGTLAMFARQIIENRYQGGFSPGLEPPGVRSALPGPSPMSFTAGTLSALSSRPHGSLAIFGDYGPEALLWADAVHTRGGSVFAAAGSLAAQAVLFLNVSDLLIGETVFLMPGLLKPDASHQAGWLAEDVLRVLLISGLIGGAILKLAGVL